MCKSYVKLNTRVKTENFSPDKTRAANLLNDFKNIPQKAKQFVLCKRDISIQEKDVD